MKHQQSGFTLIELIGVLAIITIIASAIVPNIVHEVTRAIASAEDIELDGIEKAFTQYILENKAISGVIAGQWDNDIAPYLDIPLSKILNNKGSGTRRLLIRPTNDLGGVPYNQAVRFAAGIAPQGTLPATVPLQARMILISNLSEVSPALNITNAQFDDTWNQTGTIPAGFTESNTFRIKRIVLSRHFFPVTVSCSGVSGTPGWSLDTAPVKSLNIDIFTVYLLNGTRINMFSDANIVGTIVVNKPVGITTDGSIWSY